MVDCDYPSWARPLGVIAALMLVSSGISSIFTGTLLSIYSFASATIVFAVEFRSCCPDSCVPCECLKSKAMARSVNKGLVYSVLAIVGALCYAFIQRATLVLIALIVLFIDGTFYFLLALRERRSSKDMYGAGFASAGFDSGPPSARDHDDDDDDSYDGSGGRNDNPFAAENI